MTLYIDGVETVIAPLINNELLKGFLDWRKLLGGEKVTNPNFTGNATGWTLNAGWTYNANAVDRDGAGTATMEQDVSAVVGEIYRVEYTISAYTDGSVTVTLGGTAGTARSSAATFVEYIKAATTGNLIFTPAADATFTIDTVSVKKVGYVATDGVAAWVEDRGATAGKGALHLMTEDGTKHVFGDRVGIGTHSPGFILDVAGNSQIQGDLNLNIGGFAATITHAITAARTHTLPDGTGKLVAQGVALDGAIAGGAQDITNIANLRIGSATAYVAGQLEVNKSNGAVITGLNTWNDADTPGISYHNKALNDTIGTYTAITTGHLVHRDIYQGADGTDFQPLGEQEWSVTGTVGDNRAPGKYILYLYTDAATSVKTAIITATATQITLGANVTIGAKVLQTTNLGIVEMDSSKIGIRDAANTAYKSLHVNELKLEADILFQATNRWIAAPAINAAVLSMKAMDTDGALVNVARLVGAADAYLEGTLGIVLAPVAQMATPVEGRLIYNSATDKLNFWNGSAWEVVTSA